MLLDASFAYFDSEAYSNSISGGDLDQSFINTHGYLGLHTLSRRLRYVFIIGELFYNGGFKTKDQVVVTPGPS